MKEKNGFCRMDTLMKKSKILLITGLFLLGLTGLRLIWLTYNLTPHGSQAVQGVLDLRNGGLPRDRSVQLDGEWEFYPGRLLQPGDMAAAASPEDKSYIRVPGSWTGLIPGQTLAYGSGTYRLLLRIDREDRQTYGVRISSVHTSSELFVNGQRLADSGRPAQSKEQYTARNIPHTVYFTPERDEIELLVRVANYDYAPSGGLTGSVSFGTADAVSRDAFFSMSMELIVCTVLLLQGIYSVILYLFRPRYKGLIVFALLILSTCLTIMTNYHKLLLLWIPLDFVWATKLQFLAYIGTAAFMVRFTKHIFPEFGKLRLIRWYSIFCGGLALFALMSPVQWVTRIEALLFVLNVLSSMVVPFVWLRGAVKGKDDAVFMLLAATGIFSHTVWGALGNVGVLKTASYPIDIIAAFLSLASFWFKRFFRAADQTEQLAARLQRADKLKDDFLANTSHELRNPLHGMIHIAQTVADQSGTRLDDKNRKDLELLVSMGRRMSFLLNDLIDVTRLKENDVRLRATNVRVQSVASGAFDMLRFMTEGKRIRFVLEMEHDFPEVFADENRLVQIMLNLVHNAVKYTNDGVISIRADIKDGQAQIHVSDTGVGMDEETQKLIFLPYKQGDSGLTSRGEGLGLGLRICARLVQLHGGTLTVDSSPGQGSTFSFTLPIAKRASVFGTAKVEEETATAQEPGQEAEAKPGALPASEDAFDAERPRILAVDDDPVNLKVLENIFSADPYVIVTATSGAEAKARLDTGLWDLVIADVLMPGMSGYALTRTIRERFSISELPILLLTARSRPEDVCTGFVSGANDYVTKPVDALELKSRVRALIDLKQSFRERLRLEAAWLQAQIKPHFLFNTLNTVAALGDIDTTRMRELLDVFGRYLRASFDFHNLDRLVPLGHELQLVQSYLFIEKERFGDRLQVVWELDKAADPLIPPLSVQPLVENAVKHGVLARSSGGTVRIRVVKQTDYVDIAVDDDGVGMDTEELRRVLGRKPEGHDGVGLRNVDKRLKQVYGAGLRIHSVPGQGTVVAMRIPQ